MPKSILHIAPTPFFSDRGCHIRIEGIVRCLTELSYDNTVCTYHHGRDISGVKTVRISPIKNYTQTEAGPNKYKLWADCKLLWLVLQQYRKQRPDVIHAHLHEGLLAGLLIKTLFFWHRTPLLADMQGSLSGELASHGAFRKLPFLRWPVRLIEKLLMVNANHIVCSSPHALEKIRDEFNLSNKKISLAQDGADATIPMSATDQQKFKTETGIPSDKTIVVYSGALLDSKGLEPLKQLIKNCGEHPDLHFLIIGYPVEHISAFLTEHNLDSICTLTGRINFDELPKYLSLADIAVDPKPSGAGEGSGKILNYLATGLPVIAFNTINNQQFLGSEESLAKSDRELTNLLIKLAQDEPKRSDLSANSTKQFTERYSWQVCKQQLQGAYSKLHIK